MIFRIFSETGCHEHETVAVDKECNRMELTSSKVQTLIDLISTHEPTLFGSSN